jgi:hypothetical protein
MKDDIKILKWKTTSKYKKLNNSAVNRIWDSVFTFIGTKALVAKRPVLCLNDHRLYITVLIVDCINQMIQVVPSIRSAQ